MAAPADESMDWLTALEKRVNSVSTELADLRKKNRSLVTKVNKLERKVRDGAETAKSSWAAQKAEIQQRVEGLAENEGVNAGAAPADRINPDDDDRVHFNLVYRF